MVLEQAVQKIKRVPGRPRSFDADQALDQALHVFWTKGYEATTIDDLTAATGLGRPSLYNAYGDKEALFLECMKRYGATVGCLATQAMQRCDQVTEAITAYLTQMAINFTGEDSPSGCLIACVIPAIDSAQMRAYSTAVLAGSDEVVAARLTAAVESGELPAEFPVQRRARRVTDTASALALRARAGASRAELLEDAAEGAALALAFSSDSRK